MMSKIQQYSKFIFSIINFVSSIITNKFTFKKFIFNYICPFSFSSLAFFRYIPLIYTSSIFSLAYILQFHNKATIILYI